jgi:hypothetical protein
MRVELGAALLGEVSPPAGRPPPESPAQHPDMIASGDSPKFCIQSGTDTAPRGLGSPCHAIVSVERAHADLTETQLRYRSRVPLGAASRKTRGFGLGRPAWRDHRAARARNAAATRKKVGNVEKCGLRCRFSTDSDDSLMSNRRRAPNKKEIPHEILVLAVWKPTESVAASQRGVRRPGREV